MSNLHMTWLLIFFIPGKTHQQRVGKKLPGVIPIVDYGL